MSADLAWFAGIIDGEGSITAQVMLRNGDGSAIRITPFVQVANSDEGIIRKCGEVLRANGVEFDLYERALPGPGTAVKTTKKMWNLRVSAGKRLKVLLPLLIPYLASVKREYAERLLKFIEHRSSNLLERNAKGHVRRKEYTRAELELIASVRTHARARSLAEMCAASNVMQ